MLRLRLFGGAVIETPDGPLSGAVTQRRRVALLALLAASPRHSLSRDRLIGMLWPESGAERARHLLSESLYVIHRALGEACVLAVGDEVRLDTEVLPSDVVDFDAAIASGAPERAVELYEGPFLDGFYLGDVGEFERWAETERAHRAHAYQRALAAVAARREAACDAVGAVEAWRRLAANDPLSSRTALGLMRALEAAGDRAGALQHARMHGALLREELDAAPDPEVTAYAERLRDPGMAGPRESERLPGTGASRTLAAAAIHPRSSPEADTSDGTAPAGTAVEVPVAPVERLPPAAPPPGRVRGRRARRATGIAIAVAAVVLFLAGMLISRWSGPTASVAVLPFVDLSPERDQGWFGDGITEEISDALGRMPGLRVAARTSAFALRGRAMDVREIGRRLEVEFVLEGSVRTMQDRLRVNVRLISVHDGYPLWSGSFDRDRSDVFAVQDEIAVAIASALRPRLLGGRAAPPTRAPPSDLEAYELYLRGRQASFERNPAGLLRGMELYRRAIERDPTLARAYAGLADVYALQVTYGALAPLDGYRQARLAAERALTLDPTLAEAHASLALVELYLEHDRDAADREFARALKLNPNSVDTRHRYAMHLAYEGRFDQALRQLERARELDPLSAAIPTAIGTTLYYGRRYPEAVVAYRTALALDPGFWPAHLQLAAVYLQQRRFAEALAEDDSSATLAGGHPLPAALRGCILAASGRPDEARRTLAELEERGRAGYVSPAYAAAIHAALGERDAAFAALARALELRDDWVVYLRVEPGFDPLRSDRRFDRLLARVDAGD